jgi:hypothetical protein
MSGIREFSGSVHRFLGESDIPLPIPAKVRVSGEVRFFKPVDAAVAIDH